MPEGQPGWMQAAAAQAGRHPSLPTAIKEWWIGEIGTYNILRRPLEMGARGLTADGRRQHRANRTRGSEPTLKSLRSANIKTAPESPDGRQPELICDLHARPSRPSVGDPATPSQVSGRNHERFTLNRGAELRRWQLRSGRLIAHCQADRGLCILQNEPHHFATKLNCSGR